MYFRLSMIFILSVCSALHASYHVGTGGTLTALQGAVQSQRTEIVVNAANPQLTNGGGVCGQIFRVAGVPELTGACMNLPVDAQGVRCPTGDARITISCKMKDQNVKFIIHAVGPDCRTVTDATARKDFLSSAYRKSLELAVFNNAQSISFPPISTGIYAPPNDPQWKEVAARTAIETVINFMEQNPGTIKNVNFVLFTSGDLSLYTRILAEYSKDTITLTLQGAGGQGKPQWNRLVIGSTIGITVFAAALWLLTRKKQQPQATAQQ
jgi:O-acetyl-ADP-ribose deacetylase